MFGYLKGIIKTISQKYIILDVNNVGYRIELGSVSDVAPGETREFYIYTHVRENEIRLFGFSDIKSLNLFEILLDVNGVGPKAAIGLISNLGVSQIVNSILQNDAEKLKIPGVGLKTAKKIVLELAGKIADFGFKIDKKSDMNYNKQNKLKERMNDIKSALINLGYKTFDIEKALSRVTEEDILKKDDNKLLKLVLSKI